MPIQRSFVYLQNQMSLIGGREESEKRTYNEIMRFAASYFYCCCMHFLFSAVCNSTVLVISLPSLSICLSFSVSQHPPLSPPLPYTFILAGVKPDASGPQKEKISRFFFKGLMNGSCLFVCYPPSSAAAQALDATNKNLLPVPLL